MKLQSPASFLFILFTLFMIFTQPTFAEENNNSEEKQYLFVVTAKLGELHYDKAKKVYQLSLRKIDPWLIYFSNAPKRETGFKTVEEFFTSFDDETKRRHVTGLNAALVGFDIKNKKTLRFTFTIGKPTYDHANEKLTINVRSLPGEQEMPSSDAFMEHAALFIDACPSCDGAHF